MLKMNKLWTMRAMILPAIVACALVGFADDNNQTVATTSYTSVSDTDMPRRRMLLAAGNSTRKSYTYYGSSSSNSGNTNTTKIFVEDPPDIIVDSAKIIMRLHWSNIDEPGFVPPSTTPAVSFNGVSIGHMTKLNSKTQNDEFTISPSLIKFNDYNTLWHETSVNNTGSGSWASVTIEGVVKRISLEATSNLDDKIKLSWDVSAGMSGTKYLVYRSTNRNGPFVCLNNDRPISGRQYTDVDCSAGGNYYYRVDSLSGVKSDVVVGRRVVKVVEPKFQITTLEGTVRPATKGLNQEDDVLVAGHVLKCRISAVNPTQTVTIKKVELIGRNIGGAATRKDHKIVWSSEGRTSSFWSYATGWVTGQTWPGGDNGRNAVDIMAALKSGPGYHGIYQWNIAECEYEMSGKVYKAKPSGAVTKNVYFDRDGIDNGVSCPVL